MLGELTAKMRFSIIQFHSRTFCQEKEDAKEGTGDSGGKKTERGEGGGREGGGGRGEVWTGADHPRIA